MYIDNFELHTGGGLHTNTVHNVLFLGMLGGGSVGLADGTRSHPNANAQMPRADIRGRLGTCLYQQRDLTKERAEKKGRLAIYSQAPINYIGN